MHASNKATKPEFHPICHPKADPLSSKRWRMPIRVGLKQRYVEAKHIHMYIPLMTHFVT